MASKFKRGDKVKVGKNTGTVTSVFRDFYDYKYIVKFDNKILIPPEMEYTESDLELLSEGNTEVNSNRKCTCGIKAAYGNIPVKNHSDYCDLKRPKQRMDVQNSDDLFEQLEMMFGDDDDDDFGFSD